MIMLYNKKKSLKEIEYMSERTIYKHVVVVGLDGMGVYNKNANTPCMDKIFENGAVTYEALSMSPTSSAENWGSMLLGASPEIHRMSNEMDMRRRNTGEVFPSVFKRIREAMPEARLSSFVNWRPINGMLIEDGIDVVFDNRGNDPELCDIIIPEIDNKPTFLFIQFDDIDGQGHGTGYGSSEYLAKIEEEDSFVGRIYDAYVKNGIIDDTLFIAVADHGGILTGHGSYSDGEKYIYLAATGKNVQKGTIGPAYTRDISAIVLYALGIDFPEYEEKGFSSQVPDGIFPEINSLYKTVKSKDLYFEYRPTPDYNGKKGLSEFIDSDKIRLAIDFDCEIKDISGKNTLEEHGKIVYEDGVYGKCGVLGDNGYITVKDFKLGTGSFSFGYWTKIDPNIEEGHSICANKDWFWRYRAGKGIGVAFRAHDIIFNLADGNTRFEITTGFPLDIGSGWIHILQVVDKENKKVRIYMNFKEVYVADIYESLEDDIDTEFPFNIGNDGLGTFSNDRYHQNIYIDDLMIFGDALIDSEIEKLSEYYNI